MLEGLVDTHLLESPEPDRYRMHDLVRLYAAEQAVLEEDEPARHAAVRRLTGWYLATAARAHRFLSPQSRPVPVDGVEPGAAPLEFAAYQEAIDWCERERPNLVAAVLQAAEHGCDEESWKLAAAMLGFFNTRRYLADWTSTHLAALGAARAAGDLVGEAWMQNNLGFVYFYWEETQHKALDCFERSLELRVRLGDRLGEAIALNNVGGAYHRLGDHAEAIRHLEGAMRIREELGDELGVGQTCLNIGCILTDQRELAPAEAYLLRALRITKELGNLQLYIKCLNTLGRRVRRPRPHPGGQGPPVPVPGAQPGTARARRRGHGQPEPRARPLRRRRPGRRAALLDAGAGTVRALCRPRGRDRACGDGRGGDRRARQRARAARVR